MSPLEIPTSITAHGLDGNGSSPKEARSLDKVPQLRQLIEKLLQRIVGDLVRETWNQGLCLLRIITAETS